MNRKGVSGRRRVNPRGPQAEVKVDGVESEKEGDGTVGIYGESGR